MAFRFSLATVLRFRENVEKREELALQKILVEMAHVQREITHINAAITSAHNACNETMQSPVPASHIQDMLSDIEAAVDRRNKLIESLRALDRQRTVQMQKYQSAHRDRQMLSDMRTKQRDAYEQVQARAQQKFLDDIFAARAQQN
ncbi:MAG TPA: flagellar FliJ family protein [Terracidiphilus sp.]|jgi:flagellar FliJ protein|nr:flagellar FliJ family protein [Terracidiphilus sp.]